MTRSPRFPLGLEQFDRAPGQRERATAKQILHPQRPVHQAARDARSDSRGRTPPTGLGLDSVAVRQRMVDRLKADGIESEPVLTALALVERHRFVDSALVAQAYENTSLPIGHAQTISKPSVVARMLCLLFEGSFAREQGQLGRTLEIGTGCGYQAALLARLAKSVVSIERLKALHDKARLNLADHRVGDLRLVYGDGQLGHAPRAPYQSIIAAAAGDTLPPAWLEQLAPGGRLVAPMLDASRGRQVLVVVDRRGESLHQQWLDAVHFVPLKFGAQ